jgi:hypothetical protein
MMTRLAFPLPAYLLSYAADHQVGTLPSVFLGERAPSRSQSIISTAGITVPASLEATPMNTLSRRLSRSCLALEPGRHIPSPCTVTNASELPVRGSAIVQTLRRTTRWVDTCAILRLLPNPPLSRHHGCRSVSRRSSSSTLCSLEQVQRVGRTRVLGVSWE